MICRDCEHAYRQRINYNWSDPVRCGLWLMGEAPDPSPDAHEEYHKGTAPAWCPKGRS